MHTSRTAIATFCHKSATAALMGLLVGTLALPLSAQQAAQQKANPAAKPAPKPAVAPAVDEEETPTAKSGKPGDEGIHVHGHWIIDVMDKDGKIVQHRDFQNSLTSNGGGLLAVLFNYGLTPDGLSITATGDSGTYWMYNSSGVVGALCPSTTNNCYSNLITQQGGSANPGSITLTGQFQSASAQSLIEVGTDLSYCQTLEQVPSYGAFGITFPPTTIQVLPSTVPPSACNSTFVGASTPIPGQSQGLVATTTAGHSSFTFRSLAAAPISISAGQTVQITVTISFS